MKKIYLDYNATTPVRPEVVAAMIPYFEDKFLNPSSTYEDALSISKSKRAVEQTLAAFFNDNDGKFIFTGSATESNNMAIRGILSSRRNHLITTNVEHPAVFTLAKALEKDGFEVTFLKVDSDGKLDIVELIDSIKRNTAVVSIMHANNETGVVFDIEQLSGIVKGTDPNIIFHVDATQSVGKLKIDLAKNFRNVDMFSFSGHKIYGPKGIGVLYIRRGVAVRPLILGGHQEDGLRAGTENMPYIIGLGMAIELLDFRDLSPLQRLLEDRILAEIPDAIINGRNSHRLNNTTNVSFRAIEGEGLIYVLANNNILASTGSACSTGSLALSQVLQAMHVPIDYAHGTIRFSLGIHSSAEEINYLLPILKEGVAGLRDLSPYWQEEIFIS
jgi:cysteine desulfurase